MRIARLRTQTNALRSVVLLSTPRPDAALPKTRRIFGPSFVHNDAKLPFQRIFCTSSTICAPQQSAPTRARVSLGSTQDKSISGKVPTADATEDGNPELGSAVRKQRNPDYWLEILEAFLPKKLRLQPVGHDAPARQDIDEVFKIAATARLTHHTGLDPLVYMAVNQGRHKALLYIADQQLKFVASRSSNDDLCEHPSNIQWPSGSLWNLCRKPIDVSNISRPCRRVGTGATEDFDGRYFQDIPGIKNRQMEQVWLLLGQLIIEASNLSGEQAQQTMSTVYKILALIHNLNLLPDNVYSFSPSPYSSVVRQTPVIYLLSSRILTTLSDAVWRSHQDDVISQAVSQGVPYKELGLDPPGGRFRLKVRDLGPEIWLEFVLWCCVEGGFTLAATRIVELLSNQTGEPWFAISWTSKGGSQGAIAEVDWSRVRARHGGSVSHVEGYSGEKPLAEMPPRTISVEVILAITESVLNSVNVGVPDKGISIPLAQEYITKVVAFLEPHNLSTDYFDYLTVRLLQTGAMDVDRRADSLCAWSRTMARLRSLESVESQAPVKIGFDYEVVLSHSELQAGILHQALLAYVYACDVSQSLEIFAEIQQLVDSSKLQAIGAFLNQAKSKQDGFFSAKPNLSEVDFVHSHGQLPLYSTAAFLNLVTENDLVRFGDWLLYTPDVDGPVIPRSAYAQSCIATALTRFAVAANDKQMIPDILTMRKKSKLKPSVNFLRALIDAQICLCEFEHSAELLRRLTFAQAGGYHLTNLANLGATILRLERENREAPSTLVAKKLAESEALMGDLLHGRYNGHVGTFHQRQKKLFHNQVGHILRVFENTSSNTLNDIAFSHRERYPTSNEACLTPQTFNILLGAIVDTGGTVEGKRMWNLFCADPRTFPVHSLPLQNDYAVAEEIEHELSENQFLPKWSPPSKDYASSIPFADDSIVSMSSKPGTSSQMPENDDAKVLPKPPVSAFGDIHFESGVYLQGSGWSQMIPTPNQTASGNPSPERPDLTWINPVVMPDIRTLRIIVRCALKEKRASKWRRNRQEQTSHEHAMSILGWATHYYEAFGSSKECIEQEIQEPISAVESLSSEERATDHGGLSQYPEVRERKPLNIKKYFRVLRD